MDTWYHIVGVSDGTTHSLYVNGVFAGTNVTGTLVSAATMTAIGLRTTSGPWSYFFNGTIDDVKIFNSTLSAEQITELYNNRTDLIVSQETSPGDVWQA